MPFDQKPADCIAFFGEKYGALVRVLGIDGVGSELCGGNHVEMTGEIGSFKIVQQSAIAAGTRRIEAVAGMSAFELLSGRFAQVQRMADALSTKPQDVEARLKALEKDRAQLEKDIRALQQKDAAAQIDSLLLASFKAKDLSWVVAKAQVSNPQDLRALSSQIEKQIGEGVVILASVFAPDKVSVLAACSKAAIEKGYQAGKIVAQLCGELGGKGGGKPDFAMGGGKDTDKLESVFKNFIDSLNS